MGKATKKIQEVESKAPKSEEKKETPAPKPEKKEEPAPKPPEKKEEPAPKPAEKIKPPTPKPPEKEEPAEPDVMEQMTLDALSVVAVDGIGSKITAKLNKVGIKSLEDLKTTDVTLFYEKVKVPIHRMMEYQKKAENILELELDDEIINALAAKGYTIEQTIEEAPEEIMKITDRGKTDVMEFLSQVIQITMFLDAATCRENSVALLHRKKPAKRKPKIPTEGATLDNLKVEAIDGIGATLGKRMRDYGIDTIYELSKANPVAMYSKIKVPIHRMMEHVKKANMILELELDGDMIDALAAKDYSIETAIEEDPEVIKDITKKERDEAHDFINDVVQTTMFLDVDVCRNNSIAILHKSKEGAREKKPEAPPEEEYMEFLGREQLLAKIYSGEIESHILELIRERARNKTEVAKYLEARMMPTTARELNDIIDFFVRAEVVQLEWFKGNYDVHLFMISDFSIFRSPPAKIVVEARRNLPTPSVAEAYLQEVAKYFSTYKPTHKDNIILCEHILNPDIFVTLSILREKSYPLEKFPKGFGEQKIDMHKVIKMMERIGLVSIITDESKKEWVMLRSDIAIPQFYPEYMIENIRADVEDKKIKQELALKHLDLLEIHYDTFYEIYSTFFKAD